MSISKRTDIITDLTQLKTGYGYISNRKVRYNPYVDTCFIDEDEVEGIGTTLNRHFQEEYIRVGCDTLKGIVESNSKPLLIRPFTLPKLKSCLKSGSASTLEDYRETFSDIVKNNFVISPELESQGVAHLAYPFVSASGVDPVVIDFEQTQKNVGMGDVDFVSLLIWSVTCEQTPILIKKAKKTGLVRCPYTKDEFCSSDFFRLYEKLSLKVNVINRHDLFFSVEDGMQDIFDSHYFHGGTSVFQDFVNSIRRCIASAVEHLTIKNAVLAPFANATAYMGRSFNAFDWAEDKALIEERELLGEIYKKDASVSSLLTRLFRGLRASSNITSIQDLPEHLCVDYEEAGKKMNAKEGYATLVAETPSSGARKALQALERTDGWRALPNFKAFNLASLSTRNVKKANEGDNHRQSTTLNWCEGKISEELHSELRLFSSIKSNKQTMRYLNNFIDFVIEFNDGSCEPIRTLRDLHVAHFYHPLSDDFTFKKFVEKITSNLTTQSNIWSCVRGVITKTLNLKIKDGWRFNNPMPVAGDLFKGATPQNNVTTREAMPSLFYEFCLETLTKDDYQFVKDNVPSTTVKLYNYVTGKNEKVYMPNVGHILHMMFILPMRNHQARWLDEGLMDDYIWDLDSNEYVFNTSPLTDFTYPDGQTHREKFGRTSVVQSSHRKGLNGLSLYINTNKTKSYALQIKGFTGYSIPWVTDSGIANVDEVFEIIKRQKEFNLKYSPRELTPVRPIDEDSGKYSREIFDKLPKFIPLFRDVSVQKISDVDASLGGLYLPPTAAIVRNLYKKLLIEADAKFKEKHELYRDTNVAIGIDGELLYDLHGLRVYGITDLLNQGLDREIVKTLVGHNTSIMTLYYKKLGEKEYKRLVLEAKKKSGAAIETGKAALADGIDNLGLIDNASLVDEFRDTAPDFRKGGIPKFIKGGVCMSFDCKTGGIEVLYSSSGTSKSEVTSVSGGAMRCGNCRYWRTSPRFLKEQIFYFNECAVEIHELVDKRADVFDQINTAYDELDDPDFIVNQLQNKGDRIIELLVHRVTELRRREAMLEECLKRVDVNTGNLPTTIGDVAFNPSWEDLSLFDTNMELTLQACVLGLDSDASVVQQNKLETFLSKAFNESNVKNPFLYMPNDEVKRAAIVFTLANTQNLLGAPIKDEEFEDPRLIFDDPMRSSALLKSLNILENPAVAGLIQ